MEAFLWPPLMRGLSAVRLTDGGDLQDGSGSLIRRCAPPFPLQGEGRYFFKYSSSFSRKAFRALPRWEMAFFSSGESSAKVFFRPGTKKTGS